MMVRQNGAKEEAEQSPSEQAREHYAPGCDGAHALASPSHEPTVVAVLAVALQHVLERAGPLLPLSRVCAQASAVKLEQALALLRHGDAQLFVGAEERRVGAHLEHPRKNALEFSPAQPRRVLYPGAIIGHRQCVPGVAFETGPPHDPGGEQRGRRGDSDFAQGCTTSGWLKRALIRAASSSIGSDEPTSSISWSSVVHSAACGNASRKLF